MKSNLIEITVSGRTGSGKSEVLQVIWEALRMNYGPESNITGAVNLDAKKEARETGQTANKKQTVFVLFEQNISGKIVAHD